MVLGELGHPTVEIQRAKKAFEPPDHPADEGRKGRNPEVEKVKKPFEPLLLNRRQSLRTILGWSWGILGPSWGGLGSSWVHLGVVLGHRGSMLPTPETDPKWEPKKNKQIKTPKSFAFAKYWPVKHGSDTTRVRAFCYLVTFWGWIRNAFGRPVAP